MILFIWKQYCAKPSNYPQKYFQVGQAMLEKSVSAIQHIGTRKKFFRRFPILLHTVVVSHYTYKKRGEAVKMLITIYLKSSLVTRFVQTCYLISIYNGVCTVFSYDIPQ